MLNSNYFCTWVCSLISVRGTLVRPKVFPSWTLKTLVLFVCCSEVTKSAAGDKLIFSTHGDDNFYPHDSCWAYLGLVGSVGGQTTAAAGQTVHIHDDCFSFQTVVRLVLISLGKNYTNTAVGMIISICSKELQFRKKWRRLEGIQTIFFW